MKPLLRCLVLAMIVAAPLAAAGQIAAQFTVVDLGTLGGPFSSASDINDRGQVVGGSNIDLNTTHAFIWQDGTMTDLGTLPGGSFSGASSINDHGLIAGASADAAGVAHAVVWENGVIWDLGAAPNGTNCSANAINKRGLVVGACDMVGAVVWDDGRSRRWVRCLAAPSATRSQ